MEGKLGRVEFQIENGYPLEAVEAVDELLDGLKGSGEFLTRAQALESRLESEEMKPELDAARALAKLEKKLFDDGGGSRYVKKLEKLAEQYAGTRSAERARHLARVVERA